MAQGVAAPVDDVRLRPATWALLGGNFAIGCGVMVVAGSLNDLTRSLQVSVAVGGQIITAGAVVLALGAPLLAMAAGGFDRRRLLTLSLVWYGVGHLLCALVPGFSALLPLRTATVLAAAVFTPQAASAINVMAPVAQRGRAITTVFLGWSLSSVIGMPLHSYIGETMGWRWAFVLVALLSLAAAAAVWRTVPDGVRPPPMNATHWRATLTDPLLMGLVAVTALAAAAQFTLMSYLAPYYRQVLGADATTISGLFFWFGAFALFSNVMLTRVIDRFGPATCMTVALSSMAVTFAIFPLAGHWASMALVLVPWAIGGFTSNSAQQARLGAAAPARAQALLAMNTSSIYIGQGIGAAGGGAIVAAHGLSGLAPVALGWQLLAVVLSAWLARRMQTRPHAH
jgi:DHA1 family inner membrane transport protein